MRLFLLVLCVCLCSVAGEEDPTDTPAAEAAPVEVVDETANRSDKKPNLNAECTAFNGTIGRCVKPQFCEKEPIEFNPNTIFTYTYFIYRENDCHSLLQCCALKQIKIRLKKRNTLAASCGWSNPGAHSRRSTDSTAATDEASFGEFPWMVAVLTKISSEPWTKEQYIGGGTLIHPSVVLTVAHKFEDKKPDQIKCRVGEWDSKSEQEHLPHQDRDVKKISIHEQFNRIRAQYNVALLFVETPFTLEGNHHIGLACVARDTPVPGTLCYSMGWGSSFNDTTYAHKLKKVMLPTVDLVKCQQQLRNTNLGSSFHIHHTHMCAGGEAGVDMCVGDGGSPLVCPMQDSDGNSNRYAVYGIVNYGVRGCGATNTPGIYTKVAGVFDWIEREMENKELEIAN